MDTRPCQCFEVRKSMASSVARRTRSKTFVYRNPGTPIENFKKLDMVTPWPNVSREKKIR